jgi:predicted DNA-binding transcriptional regulator AlpA
MEELLTREEVANILRKPESWLRYSERHRIVPYLKVGSHIRYRLADVEEWLASRKVNPGKPIENPAPLKPRAVARRRPAKKARS